MQYAICMYEKRANVQVFVGCNVRNMHKIADEMGERAKTFQCDNLVSGIA